MMQHNWDDDQRLLDDLSDALRETVPLADAIAEYGKGAYAWRTMQENNVHLAFGTDHPVEPLNPLRGIYACVTRELPQGSAAWQPQESLPIKDCLRAYTAGSAYAEFEENRKGRIAPGMLADLVALGADLYRNRASDVLTRKVRMTITGGRIVYQMPDPGPIH